MTLRKHMNIRGGMMKDPRPSIIAWMNKHQKPIMIILGVLTLWMICTPAKAEWTHDDTVRQSIFLGLKVIDGLQTHEIVKHPDKFKEANPFLPEHPTMGQVNRFILVGAIVPSLMAYWFEGDTRKGFQYGIILAQGAVDISNWKVGVRIDI